MKHAARIFGVFVAALLFGAAAGYGQEPERPKVRNVTFAGNEAFSSERLQGLMITRPSGFLRTSRYFPEAFAADLENLIVFYQQNGYLEAAIVSTDEVLDSLRGEIDLRIQISEGELTLVEGIEIFGNSAFPDSVLLREVQLRPGDSFRRHRVQDGMLGMLALYADEGYLDAVVKPNIQINQEIHRALIDFTVTEHQPMRIAGIRIEGLQKTDLNVVHRELRFAEGDTVRYSYLLQSQRQLYLTGLFAGVFIRPVPPADGDSTRKDILIELQENLSSEFNVSVGYGSIERVRGKLEMLTRNLAGTARQAGASVSASFIQRKIETSFTEPWTLGTRWRTDVNLMYEYREEPGYDVRQYGGRLTFGRSISDFAAITFAYRYDNAKLKHVEITETPLDFDTRVSSMTVSLTHDTRDNVFNPHRGVYGEWTNELAGSFLQGTNTFVRSIVRLKSFVPWGRHTVFGSALEAGWMDLLGSSDDIPLNERFYAGGPNSLRGFGYQMVGPRETDGDPLGGKFELVWNVIELRRPIYKMIGGVLFFEVGGIWSDITDFRPDGIRPAAGSGLRANTPIGILRLDYGVNLDRRRDESRGHLFFSLGQAF